jgi:hypothetical protein
MSDQERPTTAEIITIDATIIVGALIFLTLNLNLPFLSPTITVKEGNQTSVIVPQSNISLGENNQTSVIVPNITIQTQPSNITQEQPPLPKYLKAAPLLTAIAVAPFVVSAISAAFDQYNFSKWCMVFGFGFLIIILFIIGASSSTSS